MRKNIFQDIQRILGFLFLFVSFTNVVWARAPRDFVIQARDAKTQKERYQVHSTLRAMADDSDHWVLESRGKGRFHTYDQVTWICRTELVLQDGHLLPVKAQWDIYQKDLLVESWAHTYDFSKNRIKFLLSMPPKKVRKEFFFPLKGPTTDYTSLALFLEDLVPMVKPEHPQTFLLLTSEPRLFRVNLKFIQEEDIVLSRGPRRAIKYRLIVNMGILDEVFDRWIPPTFVWYDAEPPHQWLKYHGMETGEGSTVVDAELVQ